MWVVGGPALASLAGPTLQGPTESLSPPARRSYTLSVSRGERFASGAVASCPSRRPEPAMPRRSPLHCLSVLAILLAGHVLAAPPRAFPEGRQSADVRLQPPKDLRGYFPLEV